jgi:hypothetical protein
MAIFKSRINKQMQVRMWWNMNPYIPLVGMQISTTTMESSMGIP